MSKRPNRTDRDSRGQTRDSYHDPGDGTYPTCSDSQPSHYPSLTSLPDWNEDILVMKEPVDPYYDIGGGEA